LEGTTRVFAGEYAQARLPLCQERILTPTGACCRQIFLAGALTEADQRGPDLWFGRVADPTGVFGIRAERPDREQQQVLRDLATPSFVTVLGEAVFFSGDTAPGISLLQIQESDRTVRDRWVLRTAEITSDRLVNLAETFRSGSGPIPAATAIRQYGMTAADIRELVGMVCQALSGVAPSAGTALPQEEMKAAVLAIIRESAGNKGISFDDLAVIAGKSGIGGRELREAVRLLLEEDECYQPAREVFKPL
jgi:RPA family protein